MKINLMPPDPPIVRIRVIVFTTVVGVLSALCVYLGVTYYGGTMSLQSARSALSEGQLALHALLAKSQRVKQTTGLQQLLQEVQTIAAAAPLPEEDIQALLRTAPAGGRLTTVSFAQGQMSGTVTAPSYDVAAQFVARLQSDRTFTHVVVSSVTGGGGQSAQAQTQAQAQILGLLSKTAKLPQTSGQSGVTVTFTMTASSPASGRSMQGGSP
ncbi:MAG: PilN domain-containing protein [Bacilli bacterium]